MNGTLGRKRAEPWRRQLRRYYDAVTLRAWIRGAEDETLRRVSEAQLARWKQALEVLEGGSDCRNERAQAGTLAVGRAGGGAPETFGTYALFGAVR